MRIKLFGLMGAVVALAAVAAVAIFGLGALGGGTTSAAPSAGQTDPPTETVRVRYTYSVKMLCSPLGFDPSIETIVNVHNPYTREATIALKIIDFGDLPAQAGVIGPSVLELDNTFNEGAVIFFGDLPSDNAFAIVCDSARQIIVGDIGTDLFLIIESTKKVDVVAGYAWIQSGQSLIGPPSDSGDGLGVGVEVEYIVPKYNRHSIQAVPCDALEAVVGELCLPDLSTE